MKAPSRRGLIWMLFWTIVGPPSARADPPAELHEKAIALYRQGRLEEALPYYQKLADQSPTSIVAQKDYLWALWESRRTAPAARAARRLLALDPDNVEALNVLGQACETLGEREAALAAYRRLARLEPARRDVAESIIRLQMDLKQYDQAERSIEVFLRKFPDAPQLYVRLAQFQFVTRQYAKAEATWDRVMAFAPENPDYRYERAVARYYNAKPTQAIEDLRQLLGKHPDYRPAQDFLADDALAHGDYAAARDILTSRLTQFRPQDESRVIQLAQVYQTLGQWDDLLSLLRRFLNVNPDNGQALLMMADALAARKKPAEAIPYYVKVSSKNPASLRALFGLAEAHTELHQPSQAVETIRRARRLDPDDPALVLREAQYLFDAGRRSESRSLLEPLAKAPEEPVLTVLLYHGLTPFIRDTMLAYNLHMTRDAFDDQIRGLKDAGFTPVTASEIAAWQKRDASLPDRPIFITFDDARVDSLVYADPVLERYGFRATMFAHSANVEENLPGHTSWTQLADALNTGRWDIQAHGDRAHDRIPIDAEGRTGIFLANKRWLVPENRLETDAEWTTRLLEDHQSVKRKMKAALGITPIAFSWPEGNYGQEAIPNDPRAAEINLDIARQQWALVFQQDSFGMNLKTRDPMRLNRLQPDQKWTGARLVEHIRSNDPRRRAVLQLLRQACWNGNVREAEKWLAVARSRHVTEADLLLGQARIREAAGDLKGASRLAQESLALDNREETRAFLVSLKRTAKPAWTPTLFYQEDDQDRQSHGLEQTLGRWRMGSQEWGLIQHVARYFETGFPAASDLGGGLDWAAPLGMDHRLNARSQFHAIEGPGADTFSATGRWDARWNPSWQTQVSGGQTPYDTARAIHADIHDRFARVDAVWNATPLWRLSAWGRTGYLSDGNTRLTGVGDAGRRLGESPWTVLARATYDDMKEFRPEYYSPIDLQQYQGGLDFTTGAPGVWQLSLRYLPGMGKEQPTEWETVHDVEASAYALWKGITISPSFSFRKTPTYRGSFYFLTFSVPL